MIKRFVLFLVVITAILFSKENDPYDLAIFGGMPSSVVGGCVNVITGDYFINQSDHVVRSHEPIAIQRSYTSRKSKGEDLYLGWRFPFFHTIAYAGEEDELEVPEKSGVYLIWKPNRSIPWNAKDQPDYILDECPGGLTNCFGKEMGARFDPTNNEIYIKKGDWNRALAVLVKGPDGSQRYYEYEPKWHQDQHISWEMRRAGTDVAGYLPLLLRWEILPNGNKISYNWHRVNHMNEIHSLEVKNQSGTKKFAQINFEYHVPNHKHRNGVTIYFSDRRKLHYAINSYVRDDYARRFWLLVGAGLPEHPDEHYHPYWECPRGGRFVARRIFPDNRYVEPYLYSEGYFPEFNIHVRRRRNYPFYGKVYSIRESFGQTPGGVNVPYRFNYNVGKYRKRAGYTDVYDPYNNLTRYVYNEDFLLTHILRYIKSETVFSQECFAWCPKEKGKPNRLLAKTVTDGAAVPIFAYVYRYDHKGNVKQEERWGNLTGTLSGQFLTFQDKTPVSQGAECYTIKRIYSEAPFYLLTKEEFPNGKIIEYHYVPSTDLLSAKFIYSKQAPREIRQRIFYVYDDTILIREIHDDGVKDNPDDLTGVTQRIIRDIKPVQNYPYIGFPEVVTQKYFDLQTKSEKLLKRQKYLYTIHGQVEAIEHYDANNQLRYFLRYEYDGKGRLSHFRDPLNRLHQVSYDANGNPIYENSEAQDFVQTHGFDLANLPYETKQRGNTGVRVFQNSYDALHHKVTETDQYGNTTSYNYHPLGLIECITKPPLITELGKSQGPQVHYVYNALGKPIKETDAEGNITKTSYNSQGAPSHITHPDGAEESFVYDLSGNLKTYISPEGTKTEYEYDFLDRNTSKRVLSKEGECLSEESYTYNAYRLIEKIHPDGIKTTYHYDGAGRKIGEATTIGDQNRQTLYTYDPAGREHTITTPVGSKKRVVIKEYDLADRLKKQQEEDENGKIYCTIRYDYDDFDNQIALTKEVQIGDSIERSYYDSFKRLVKKVDPVGNVTTIKYNDAHQNSLGKKVLKKTTINPKGTQTVEVFDAHGNLSVSEKIDPTGALLVREEFFYNLNDQKIKQVSSLFNPNRTIVKAWKYDNRNRVCELCEGINEPNEKVTRYVYTPNGQLFQVIKPSGITITRLYDGLGRVISLQSSDGTIHYILAYDKIGHIVESQDQIKGTITKRSYNHFGDLLEETLGSQLVLKKDYDCLSRKTKLTLPDGSAINYTYDPYHLTKVERLSKEGSSYYFHEYLDYDRSHHLLSEKFLGNLGTAEYELDQMGRQIQMASPYSLEKIASFDPNGNVLEYHRTLNYQEEILQLDYDALDQLIEEQGSFSHQYLYDSHHNRLQKNAISYRPNALHELEATDHTQYRHDRDGNLTLEETEYGGVEYLYDGLDRLIEIRIANQLVRFHYDYWNRMHTQERFSLRDGKWTLTKRDHLLYDDQNELGAYPQQLRVLGQSKGAEIGAAIALEERGQLYVPQHDLFGNVIALLDSFGNVQEAYRYSAFGEERIFDSSGKERAYSAFSNPWRYQSKRKIEDLVYFGRRFYSPEIGRWLSPDPKGFNEGPNLYQYVLNNPYRYHDPDGQSVEALAASGAASGVTIGVLASNPVGWAVAGATVAAAAVAWTGYRAYELVNDWRNTKSSDTVEDSPDVEVEAKEKKKRSQDVYVPDRPLPQTEDGVPIPDTDAPHTQLGTKEGRKGNYPKAREFDRDGNPVRDIDFTDHGYPTKHTNPHQHRRKGNPTGGTPSREAPESVPEWEY